MGMGWTEGLQRGRFPAKSTWLYFCENGLLLLLLLPPSSWTYVAQIKRKKKRLIVSKKNKAVPRGGL
jgi:hypothetical protein